MKKCLVFILIFVLSFPLKINAKTVETNELNFINNLDKKFINNISNLNYDDLYDKYYIIPISFNCCSTSTMLFIEKENDYKDSNKEIIKKFYDQHSCYEYNDEQLINNDCSIHLHSYNNIKENNNYYIENNINKSEHIEFNFKKEITSPTREACNPCLDSNFVLISTVSESSNGPCILYCFSSTKKENYKCTVCNSIWGFTYTYGRYHSFVHTGSTYSTPDCHPVHPATFHEILLITYYKCSYCNMTKYALSVVGQVYCYGY